MNDFNGIWLAAPILELPDLNLTEKVILSQVITLSRESECRAQNEYIAGKTGLTKTSISLTLGKLQDKGYLVIDAGQTAGNKRQMWPSLKSLHTLFKNLKEGEQSSLKIFKTLYKNFKEVVKNLNEGHSDSERPYLKILHTLFKNLKELIYRIDNKIDNKEDNKPSKEYKAVPARADAPFWSILIKPVDFYRDRKAYKAFVKAEVKKNSPRSAAPPLADNQFAYEYAAGKTEVLQWPDSFSPAMRDFYLSEWLPYHRQRGSKRLTSQGVKLQLSDLSELSDVLFFDTLNKAIKSNWLSFHVKSTNTDHAGPTQNPGFSKPAASVPAFGQGAILPGGSAYRKQVIRRGITAGTGDNRS